MEKIDSSAVHLKNQMTLNGAKTRKELVVQLVNVTVADK